MPTAMRSSVRFRASIRNSSAVRLGDDHVQQRQKRLVKSLLTQLREAGHGMTAGQKLEYLVDKTGGGHVSRSFAILGIGASVAGSIVKPSFAAMRTARIIRTGSSL